LSTSPERIAEQKQTKTFWKASRMWLSASKILRASIQEDYLSPAFADGIGDRTTLTLFQRQLEQTRESLPWYTTPLVDGCRNGTELGCRVGVSICPIGNGCLLPRGVPCLPWICLFAFVQFVSKRLQSPDTRSPGRAQAPTREVGCSLLGLGAACGPHGQMLIYN
jgi:hypothetical protein